MYIGADDLTAAMGKMELVQLTNDNARGTEPDAQVIDAAVRYACDLVDGYLRGRYVLPLAETPTVLQPLCINIARHFCTAAASTAPTFRNRLKPPTTRRLKHLSLSVTAKSISVSPHWTSRRNLSRAHITSECATKWIWEATDERDTSDY